MRSIISKNFLYLRATRFQVNIACKANSYNPPAFVRSCVNSHKSPNRLLSYANSDQRLYICTTGINLNSVKIAEYEEIKCLPNHPEKLLVDVREQEELAETGKIPTSINIPLAKVVEDLGKGLTADEFKAKYGRKKPTADTEIIFSCLKGRRSLQAAECAVQLGFKNVKSYEGSWEDWSKREALPN